jgi:hypothetical protein
MRYEEPRLTWIDACLFIGLAFAFIWFIRG